MLQMTRESRSPVEPKAAWSFNLSVRRFTRPRVLVPSKARERAARACVAPPRTNSVPPAVLIAIRSLPALPTRACTRRRRTHDAEAARRLQQGSQGAPAVAAPAAAQRLRRAVATARGAGPVAHHSLRRCGARSGGVEPHSSYRAPRPSLGVAKRKIDSHGNLQLTRHCRATAQEVTECGVDASGGFEPSFLVLQGNVLFVFEACLSSCRNFAL